MKHNPPSEQQLTQVVDKLCKQQPLRKAPTDLYERVMREVQLRKKLPWWRKSFLHWPLLMQVMFVAAALLTAQAGLLITDWLGTNVFASATSLAESSSLAQGTSAMLAVGERISAVFSNMVPSSWLYGLVLVIALMYLVLFGIGITTYKTLYASRAVAR